MITNIVNKMFEMKTLQQCAIIFLLVIIPVTFFIFAIITLS